MAVEYYKQLKVETYAAISAVQNPEDAFNSFLKLSKNGYRFDIYFPSIGTSFANIGNMISLWTSVADENFKAWILSISPDEFKLVPVDRKVGSGVRCIQDYEE